MGRLSYPQRYMGDLAAVADVIQCPDLVRSARATGGSITGGGYLDSPPTEVRFLYRTQWFPFREKGTQARHTLLGRGDVAQLVERRH